VRKKIKAIFFDIDGTLRDFETGRIPDSAKEALLAAREAGIRLFIATGRHKLEMEEENLLEGLPFEGYVTLNGQYCYDEERLIYHYPIKQEAVTEVLNLLKEEPFPCMFMEADRMYINSVDNLVIEAQEVIGTRLPPLEDVERARDRAIYQIVPYLTVDRISILKNRLTDCQFIQWHDGCAYDIVPADGCKSEGIYQLANDFGLTMEEIAAIGDGGNDIDMIAGAGFGVAMGNAKKEVKAAADYITDSIENHGLSKAIFHILENNKTYA
jgi:hypothetical protein